MHCVLGALCAALNLQSTQRSLDRHPDTEWWPRGRRTLDVPQIQGGENELHVGFIAKGRFASANDYGRCAQSTRKQMVQWMMRAIDAKHISEV